MAEKTKQTISVSFDKSQIEQIEQIDKIAREERVQSGENVTRSQIVRRIVDAALGSQSHYAGTTPPPSPASTNTPEGGRTAERSDGGAGALSNGRGDNG